MAIPGRLLNSPSRTMPCRGVFRASLLGVSMSTDFVSYGTLSGFKISNNETCICLKTVKLEVHQNYLPWNACIGFQ